MDFSVVARKKTDSVKKLIQQAAELIFQVGVPLKDLSPRRIEKMSMCLLALCDITNLDNWKQSKCVNDKHILKSRDIIRYLNKHFEEKISEGSYDDIRRKDLIRLVDLGLVINSANNTSADTNDGTRGNAVSAEFASLIHKYGTPEWGKACDEFQMDEDYLTAFSGKRNVKKLTVTLADGVEIFLDDGPHNKIQKAIIDDFLPVFGYDATVLYLGDTSEKKMIKYNARMKSLGLNVGDRGMLPDIVAFSESKKWLYLIEAVHSSNPLNPERVIQLKRTVLKDCPYGVVFVTAFLSKKDFSKWMTQIAWETEVWLAEAPEHLIHFNGDKFIGPHSKDPEF